jgi:hypothetical protein
MFTAVLFTTAKTQAQHTCLSVQDGIKKTWLTHIVEHYSVTNNEIMLLKGKWLEPEVIHKNPDTEKDKLIQLFP